MLNINQLSDWCNNVKYQPLYKLLQCDTPTTQEGGRHSCLSTQKILNLSRLIMVRKLYHVLICQIYHMGSHQFVLGQWECWSICLTISCVK